MYLQNVGLGCTVLLNEKKGLPLRDMLHRLLDSLVVECSLRVREVPGSFPRQGPRHTKDVIKMAPVVPLFNSQH